MTAKELLLAQYDLNSVMFNNVTADISNGEANEKLAESINNIRWIAGHLVWGQSNFARIGGVNFDVAWVNNFARGAEFSNSDDLPKLDEIKATWNKLVASIRAGLDSLPGEALDSTVDFNHPIFPFDQTLAGMLAFINEHQAYHIGQISVLRRGFNKEPMEFFEKESLNN